MLRRKQIYFPSNIPNLLRFLSSKLTDGNTQNSDQKDGNRGEYPEVPIEGSCCMSGCTNCVWLEYAEKLSNYFQDAGEKALQEIEEKVTDTSMKAFLLHELRMRQKSKPQD